MPKETPQNSKDLQQDPLNLPGAIYSKKIRQIWYMELKKRKRLINIVQDLKRKWETIKKLREMTMA